MNRLKKEEQRKHDAARKGLSEDEVKTVDLEDELQKKVEQGGRYYAHWPEKPGLTGPFISIAALMKPYLPIQLARWLKKVPPPDTSVHIYLSETSDFSMAKIISPTRSPLPADKPFSQKHPPTLGTLIIRCLECLPGGRHNLILIFAAVIL